jgi:hypothetical protein
MPRSQRIEVVVLRRLLPLSQVNLSGRIKDALTPRHIRRRGTNYPCRDIRLKPQVRYTPHGFEFICVSSVEDQGETSRSGQLTNS